MSERPVEIETNVMESKDIFLKQVLCIHAGVILLKEEYDVYNAYQYLLIEKEYCNINKLDEENYYILYSKDNRIEIEKINITIYELFMNIIANKDKSIGEISSMIAALYADNKDDMDMIYSELIYVAETMFVKGILCT